MAKAKEEETVFGESERAASPKTVRLPIESWLDRKSSADWLFAAAKAISGWAIGQEVTEAEFDAAIARAGGLKMDPQ